MGCCDPCGNVARTAIIAFTVIGVTLQILSAEECDWVRYTSDASDRAGFFGPFYWQLADAGGQCTAYDASDISQDALLKASRSMMVMALIFAFAAGCLVTFEFLLCAVPCASCLESLSYAAAILCSCLVYLAFGSQFCYDNSFQCSFGQGSTYNLMALLAYCGAWVTLCCSPKPTPLLRQCNK